MRKEYKDRALFQLVNPGFTLEEYELGKFKASAIVPCCEKCGCTLDYFESTCYLCGFKKAA